VTPECTEEERWRAQIDECESIHDFNKFVLSCIERPISGNNGWLCSSGDLYYRMACAEAKKRHYHGIEREGKLFAVEMKPAKGDGMWFGYSEGVLYVDYGGGKRKVYDFPNFDQDNYFKLLRGAFPRHLFNGYKKKWEEAQKEAANG
jgi:hypothetical protein